MPYLDRYLIGKHKASCKKPKAKRLYIRGYGSKESRRQILIPYGIVCPYCKVFFFLDEQKEIEEQQRQKAPDPEIVENYEDLEAKMLKTLATKKGYHDKPQECLFCHKPTLTYYDGRSCPKEYRGTHMQFYYPDGKEIYSSNRSYYNELGRSGHYTACCLFCYNKHFKYSKSAGFSKPVTDLAKKVVKEHCTFPYPEEIKV